MTFFRHTYPVYSVIFSSDDKQIISASHDGSVRLWTVATGKEIAQFIPFSGTDSQLSAVSRGLTVETQTASYTATTNLSVIATVQNQPIKNIKIFVN